MTGATGRGLSLANANANANGIQRMRQLADRFPVTCWGDKARRRLGMLMPAPSPTPRTKVPE